MSRLHLPIQNPCHEDWTAMPSDGDARRFCDQCNQHVHDLSSMTEHGARTVLAERRANGRVCVRYTMDDRGNIAFKVPTTEAPSSWRTTMAAAGMALALMTGCAESEPDRVLDDKCVFEVGPWSFTLERGEGSCPAEPEPDPDHGVVGKIEAMPVEIDDPQPRERMGDIGPEVMGAPEAIEIEVMGDMPAPLQAPAPYDPPKSR